MVKGYSVPDGYMGLLNGKYQLFETEQAYYECLLESEEIWHTKRNEIIFARIVENAITVKECVLI